LPRFRQPVDEPVGVVAEPSGGKARRMQLNAGRSVWKL
jgi:hypothetical protein